MANKTLQKVDIFISSPGDVSAERQAAIRVINRLNKMQHISERFVLKPLAYEEEVPAAVGDAPQRTVDRYMQEAGKADIFICILWSRMGTPVIHEATGESFESGTEYEFIDAYRSNQSRHKPYILLYRGTGPFSADVDLEQAVKVQRFFKKFEGADADYRGLYGTFASTESFEDRLFTDLDKIISKNLITPDDDDIVLAGSHDPVADAAAAIRTRRDFYKHIPMPANYVQRGELLEELRDSLLGDAANIAFTSAIKGSLTALHGMGGIGKSVMARALCDDPAVQAAFPDGILWTTLGQEASLLTKLREWVQALGGVISENAPTLDSIRAVLAELLQDRACLLVVDDVWERKHAAAFRLGGPRCRLLITTRDAEIARSMGAQLQPIPTMSEVEAVALLDEWADGHLSATPPSTKAKIVNRVGRLPLAIKLSGAQLQHRSPEKWLESFDARKLKSKRPEDIHDSLEQTFGLSLDALGEAERRLYATLSIFREDQVIHEAGIKRLWMALGDLDDEDTLDLMEDLSSRALLEIAGVAYPRAVVLHDLLRDFIDLELSADAVQGAHDALLDAYEKSLAEPGWHNGATDGYFFENLAYHLRAAGRRQELYALLTSNTHWMNAKFTACRGDMSFLGDLELALSDFNDPLSAGDFITVSMLYAVRQVVGRRSDRYDDDDLRVLVRVGREEEAITQARVREPDQRIAGFIAIYRVLADLGRSDDRLIKEIGDLASAKPDAYARALSLYTTIKELTDEKAFSPRRALPVEAEFLLDNMLNAALTVENGNAKLALLTKVFNLLSWLDKLPDGGRIETIFRQQVQIARQSPTPISHTLAMAALADLSANVRRADLFEEILIDTIALFRNTTFPTKSRISLIQAMANSAAQLKLEHQAKELYIEAVELTTSLPEERDALARELAADIATHYPDLALDAVDKVEDPFERIATQVRIAQSRFNSGDKSDESIEMYRLAVTDWVSWIETHGSPDAKATTLRTAALLYSMYESDDTERLIASLLDRAYAATVLIDGEIRRNTQFNELAKFAAGQKRFDIAIQAETAIQNSPVDSIEAIKAIIEAIVNTRKTDATARISFDVDALLNKALGLANLFEDVYFRSSALRDVAIIFAKAGYVERSLAVARMVDDRHMVWSLSGVTVVLSDTRQADNDKLNELVDEVNRWFDHPSIPENLLEQTQYLTALGGLATVFHQHGHDPIAGNLFGLAQSIADELLERGGFRLSANQSALGLLAEALEQTGRHDDARTLAARIKNPYWATQAMGGIASSMIAEGRYDDALEMAEDSYKWRVTSEVAVARTHHDVQAGLDTAHSIEPPLRKALTLARILKNLRTREKAGEKVDNALYEQILNSVWEITRTGNEIKAIHTLSVALATVGHLDAAEKLAHALEPYNLQRADLARQRLAMIAESMGQHERAVSIARTIKDMTRRASSLARFAVQRGDENLLAEANMLVSVTADDARRDMIEALARDGQFLAAFEQLGQCGIEPFIMAVSRIVQMIEAPSPDFIKVALANVIRSVMYSHTDWYHIERCVRSSAESETQLALSPDAAAVMLKPAQRYTVVPAIPANQPFALHDKLRAYIHYFVALGYTKIDDFERARGELEQAYALTPDDEEILSLLALAEYKAAEYRKAGQRYTQLIELREARDQPQYTDYFFRGVSYAESYEYTKALDDLNHVVAMQPEVAHLRLWRGRLYRSMHNFEAAMADFEHVLKMRPDLAYAILEDRALVYMEMLDFENALAEITRAMRLQPNNAIHLNTRGFIYFDLGDYDTAFADFTLGVRVDPKIAGNYNGRGWIHMERQEYDSAIEEFTHACETGLVGKRANMVPRIYVWLYKGEYDLALDSLEEWEQLDPDNAGSAMVDRALIALKRGETTQASAYLDTAYTLLNKLENEVTRNRRLMQWAVLKGDMTAAAEFGNLTLERMDYFRKSSAEIYMRQWRRMLPERQDIAKYHQWFRDQLGI